MTDELDTVFSLLSNARRRYAIRYCVEQEGPVDLGELAKHVAAREAGTTMDVVTTDRRTTVYVALYQTHLSKLAAADVVEWDKRAGIVEARPRARYLCRYVDRLEAEGLVDRVRTMVGSVW